MRDGIDRSAFLPPHAIVRSIVRVLMRHVEDALVEIEEVIGDSLAKIDNALDDDKAEAEETGQAERQRRSWFPRYRAA